MCQDLVATNNNTNFKIQNINSKWNSEHFDTKYVIIILILNISIILFKEPKNT